MMKYLCLILLLCFSAQASHQRVLSDFHGDQLVVGAGNYPYYLGQRTINKDTEYSIDIYKRVYPCLRADGMDDKTYKGMPDNRFFSITFEHIGVCPFPSPDMMTLQGHPRTASSGAYEASKWDAAKNAQHQLTEELFRILKPEGRLIYMSSVLETKNHFEEINLWDDERLALGLQAWQYIYKNAGFTTVDFQLQFHDGLQGWFVQMVAIKPSSTKKQKTGN